MSTQGTIYNIQRMSVQDGPGLRTTVFFKGCPLRCRWCSNPESQSLYPQLMHFQKLCTDCRRCTEVCPSGAVILLDGHITRDFSRCINCGRCAEVCPTAAAAMSGRVYTSDEVMNEIRKDASFYWNSNGGVTFSGGECTMQGEFLLSLLDACAAEGFHTCVDTCGVTEPHLFKILLGKADLFLFDVKHMNSEEHKRLTGLGNERILENLKTGLSQCPEKFRIRVPLMPHLNDSEDNIASLAGFLDGFGIHHVDILPCHTFGSSKYDALHLTQPGIPKYEPSQLQSVLSLFASHGMNTEIIS
ncbi:MAG: glycyl-radical enzyme activating protein [Mailhella sp.]